MIHIYEKGFNINQTTLVLLHGTGGDEHDLLALGRELDSSANLLSIRGNVQENGMNRFFKRLSPGVFDLDDLRFRSMELLSFLQEASRMYDFSLDAAILVGYSNGANIAAAMLLLEETRFGGAILHHPMLPIKPNPETSKKSIPVLITTSHNDTIVPYASAKELVRALTGRGHEVNVHEYSHGHQLTQAEVENAKNWLRLKKPTTNHL